MNIELKVITPDQVLVDTTVKSVNMVAGLEKDVEDKGEGVGEQLGILAQHTPLMSVLDAGYLNYETTDGKKDVVWIGEGFVQVKENRILAVATRALSEDDLKDERKIGDAIKNAEAALEAAKGMNKDQQGMFEARLTKQIVMLNGMRGKLKHNKRIH